MKTTKIGELHGAFLPGSDPAIFRLEQPFRVELKFRGRLLIFTAPAGFETDGASIPKAVQNIFSPWGAFRESAVIHDLLYSTKGVVLFEQWPELARLKSAELRSICDDIFLELMYAQRINWLTRNTIWMGVRLGGGFVWENKRPRRGLADGILPALAMVLVLGSGCVQTRLKTVDGTTFETVRFFWNGGINEMTLTTPHGTANVRGYKDKSAETAEAIARGVMEGAAKGLIPIPH